MGKSVLTIIKSMYTFLKWLLLLSGVVPIARVWCYFQTAFVWQCYYLLYYWNFSVSIQYRLHRRGWKGYVHIWRPISQYSFNAMIFLLLCICVCVWLSECLGTWAVSVNLPAPIFTFCTDACFLVSLLPALFQSILPFVIHKLCLPHSCFFS